MPTSEDPTPTSNAVSRVIAASERRDAIDSIALRLGQVEDQARRAETVAHEARAAATSMRAELAAVAGRVGVLEPQVASNTAAVASIKLDVARLSKILAGFSGLTILGGAIANAVMHRFGML